MRTLFAGTALALALMSGYAIAESADMPNGAAGQSAASPAPDRGAPAADMPHDQAAPADATHTDAAPPAGTHHRHATAGEQGGQQTASEESGSAGSYWSTDSDGKRIKVQAPAGGNSRAAADAKERPITEDLNKQALQAATAAPQPSTTTPATPPGGYAPQSNGSASAPQP